MTTSQKMALENAEEAALRAVERHDQARKAYLKVLFQDGPMGETQDTCRKRLKEARLVLQCCEMALRHARENAGVKVH